MSFVSVDYRLIAPELAVAFLAFFVLVADLLLPAGRKKALWWLTLGGLGVALVLLGSGWFSRAENCASRRLGSWPCLRQSVGRSGLPWIGHVCTRVHESKNGDRGYPVRLTARDAPSAGGFSN